MGPPSSTSPAAVTARPSVRTTRSVTGGASGRREGENTGLRVTSRGPATFLLTTSVTTTTNVHTDLPTLTWTTVMTERNTSRARTTFSMAGPAPGERMRSLTSPT